MEKGSEKFFYQITKHCLLSYRLINIKTPINYYLMTD